MKNIEYATRLLANGSSISVEEIIADGLCRRLDSGLRVLTICNDGTNRSVATARALNEAGIPSISLRGGLKQLFDNPELTAQIPQFTHMASYTPNCAVILTPEERKYFLRIISNMRCSVYPSTSAAVESVLRMEN